ncbi:unnamed protein product [Strongylus vulgaris]|uniref:Uncharacterized protein n=1 Tax=Strongylus vulgaris TaxID=40348 RepID=A0A3P7KX22_STRVU|nr:unnamed protein product [Strongylus vulgaris]
MVEGIVEAMFLTLLGNAFGSVLEESIENKVFKELGCFPVGSDVSHSSCELCVDVDFSFSDVKALSSGVSVTVHVTRTVSISELIFASLTLDVSFSIVFRSETVLSNGLPENARSVTEESPSEFLLMASDDKPFIEEDTGRDPIIFSTVALGEASVFSAELAALFASEDESGS